MIPPVEELKQGTLGATYEHINKLLKEQDFDARQYIKYNPNLSSFEKKVQAIIIDTYKLEEGVINCLLSDDADLVRRVLKCDWFFEGVLPPKAFEDEIFPNVSFSTRCKIINQLARNVKSEQDAEELFYFTNEKYGSKYAEMFLAKCSYDFVSDYFTKGNPSFNYHESERTLINICKRFPDIVTDYFDKMCKEGSPGIKIVKYFAKHNPLAVFPMMQNNSRDLYFLRFGKKSSKALHSEFSNLMKNTPLSMLMEKMNMPVIYKRLSFEEKMTFLKLIVHEHKRREGYIRPRDWYRAVSKLRYFVELTRPSDRVRLVEAVFYELFNENYLDHPEVWSLHFIELFPENYRNYLVEILENTAGEKSVRNMLRSECKDRDRDLKDTFIYLLGFKTAFPILTEMMSQMRTHARREVLLREMVKNCIINNDPDGLESVIRYMSIRHANEDPRLVCDVVMHNLIPSPKIVNLKVWRWLEKMVTLLMLRFNDSHVFGVVMEAYIGFRIRNSLDAKNQVKSVVKLSVVTHPSSFVLVRNMGKSYSKDLIMLYYKEIFSGDAEYSAAQIKEKLMLSLLMSINEFNRKRRHGRINMEDLPLLVEGVDTMVESVRNWKYKHLLGTAIKNDRFLRSRYARHLSDISMKVKTLKYLMKYHPYCIIEKFGSILEYILEHNDNRETERIFTYGSQIDFLGYMVEIEEVIADKFMTSYYPFVKVRALKAYSHITTLEHFTKLVKHYVPEEEKVRFDSSRAEFYEIQTNVPAAIRNVKPIWKNVDFVWKYMKKGFLKWVLPSFFALCHHTKVSTVIPLLKDQFSKNEDVSVKKVILCCILDLSTKVERLEYCQMLWEREKHSSVREFVFHALLRSLRDDQSGEIFDMVKRCITEADEIVVCRRLKLRIIPTRFMNEYVSALWEFTEKHEGKTFALKFRKEIVGYFDAENISALSGEFCQKILKLYLFESNAEVLAEKFCIDYILNHSQSMDQKLRFLLELLGERRAKLPSITYFIKRLKNFASSDPEPVFHVFEGLLKEWPKMYGLSKMFEEYLILEYMKGYSTAFNDANLRKELFAARLGSEFRKIVNSVPNYENFVEIFKSTMYEFMRDFKLLDVIDFVIDNFLGTTFGNVEGIIAIYLIPNKALESLKMKAGDPNYKATPFLELRKRYGRIYRKLMEKNNDVFKIYMNMLMDNAVD